MKKHIALLGNFRGAVKPWYLPFDFVFVRVPGRGKRLRTAIARNRAVPNVYGLMVEIYRGEVVGLWEKK